MNNTSAELGGSDSDDAMVHNEQNVIQTNGIFSAPGFPARKRGRPAKPDSEKV